MEFNEIRKEANKKVLEIMQLINTGIDFEYFFDLDSVPVSYTHLTLPTN